MAGCGGHPKTVVDRSGWKLDQAEVFGDACAGKQPGGKEEIGRLEKCCRGQRDSMIKHMEKKG